jgi:hypothetical protein
MSGTTRRMPPVIVTMKARRGIPEDHIGSVCPHVTARVYQHPGV